MARDARGRNTRRQTGARSPAAPGRSATPGGASGLAVGDYQRRQKVVLALSLALLLLFAGRLIQVQVFEASALAAEVQQARQREYTLHAERGDILDADGAVLATSAVRYNIVVDQRQIPAYVQFGEEGESGQQDIVGRGASAAAAQLAPILGVPEHELGATLTGEAGYLKIAEDVTPEVRAQVLDLGINGVTSEQTTIRLYPAQNTGGNLVGWVNDEGEGAAGLEYSLQSELAGVDGSRAVEIGVGGTVIPGAAQTITPAEDGQIVHTTIDSDLQQTCQNVIDAQVGETSAEWGAVVVTEVATGRILALCESGMIDPNDPTGYGRIDAVHSPYEPGSTGKILTVAAALNEGLVTPTSTFDVPYTLTRGSQTFKDHTPHPDQRLTTTGILAESSNTGTIQIGEMMDEQTRQEYMAAFGWTSPSGIELGESAAINVEADWDGRTTYTTMFGQGVAVNLLQNTNVIATLANDGVRLPLHLVDGYSDSDGSFTSAQLAEGVEVVSPEVADQMILMLESVTTTDGATGNRAAIEGYRVAGKTGTAQVADGEGGVSDTAASFVGVVPAEDPQIAVGVVIYKPQSGFFGGTIAAPVFRDVASFALTTLGIPPSGEVAELYPTGLDGDSATDG